MLHVPLVSSGITVDISSPLRVLLTNKILRSDYAWASLLFVELSGVFSPFANHNFFSHVLLIVHNYRFFVEAVAKIHEATGNILFCMITLHLIPQINDSSNISSFCYPRNRKLSFRINWHRDPTKTLTNKSHLVFVLGNFHTKWLN